jgi:hypothetical protein
MYVTDEPVARPTLTGVPTMTLNKLTYSGLLVVLIAAGVCRVEASTVVYEAFEFVTSNTTQTTPLDDITPGLYQATLVDYESPDPFYLLSFGVTQGSTTYGFLNGTGSFTFDVLEAGTLQTHLVAWPNDPTVPSESRTSLYSVQIKALNSMVVPVPPAFWLFLSGLAGIIGVTRQGWRFDIV